MGVWTVKVKEELGYGKGKGKNSQIWGYDEPRCGAHQGVEKNWWQMGFVSHVNSNRLVVAQCRGISKICQEQEVRKWGQVSTVTFPRLEDLEKTYLGS